MTEKLSECCRARTDTIFDPKGEGEESITICSKCGKTCTIASKPDASPDRLLTEKGIRDTFRQYLGSYSETNNDMTKWRLIAKTQDAITYPIALEDGRKIERDLWTNAISNNPGTGSIKIYAAGVEAGRKALLAELKEKGLSPDHKITGGEQWIRKN